MTGKIVIECKDGGVSIDTKMQDVSPSDKGFLLHALSKALKMSVRDLSEFLLMETLLREAGFEDEDRRVGN